MTGKGEVDGLNSSGKIPSTYSSLAPAWRRAANQGAIFCVISPACS